MPAPATVTAVGNTFTVKLAVLPLPGALLQSDALRTLVIVSVVLPALLREPDGMVNVPDPPVIVTDVVAPEAVLAPERLYVMV